MNNSPTIETNRDQISRPKRLRPLTVLTTFGVLLSFALPTRAGDTAVDRARRQVRMLDDLYKTAIVLITTHYVGDPSQLSGATAAIALFDAMKKKGWHEVRLLDASGKPTAHKNLPQDDFEKEAVAKLRRGESYFDQALVRDGKRYLRAATPIPVVMKKCVMCHPHYSAAKAGEAIGALSYIVPIE